MYGTFDSTFSAPDVSNEEESTFNLCSVSGSFYHIAVLNAEISPQRQA
jgi:hypothetical protein